MQRKDFKFILSAFVIWRVSLFLFLFIALKQLPLQRNFLGGGMANYISNPFLWSWLNFDGEHFLSIAQIGYQNLTYFFFPLYPLTISLMGTIFGKGVYSLAVIGLLVSNISFLGALFGFWHLVRLDYSVKIAKLAILFLLAFPTSFFFASYYSESLFLLLVVWSFYFARKEKWRKSVILGIASTVTRVVGFAAFLSLLPEFLNKKRFEVFLIPAGLGIYMLYLWKVTGDPFNFINTVGIFGPQRSSEIVLLPQVFYRYVFKILPNTGWNLLPFFELSVASVFTILTIAAFKKLRLSYAIYLLVGFVIPTLSGSFSSLPRYVLVLFPAFILVSNYLVKLPRALLFFIFSILILGLAISTMLFTRGFWIS